MITRTPFGDCYCIWAEPKLYDLNCPSAEVDSETAQQKQLLKLAVGS